RARQLIHQYNYTTPDEINKRQAILRDLLGRCEDAYIEPSFRCMLVHNISASMSRLYVGRVLDKDGRPLLDAQPLNHPFLSLGPSG
ncbi:hypothetical protein MJM99_28945, partial [Salmonella enterica subsp. enterica serovar Kentucky]|nr:hypothetical protein [Salmonella enterica subsp. enterica serovar Kentucky]